MNRWGLLMRGFLPCVTREQYERAAWRKLHPSLWRLRGDTSWAKLLEEIFFLVGKCEEKGKYLKHQMVHLDEMWMSNNNISYRWKAAYVQFEWTNGWMSLQRAPECQSGRLLVIFTPPLSIQSAERFPENQTCKVQILSAGSTGKKKGVWANIQHNWRW